MLCRVTDGGTGVPVLSMRCPVEATNGAQRRCPGEYFLAHQAHDSHIVIFFPQFTARMAIGPESRIRVRRTDCGLLASRSSVQASAGHKDMEESGIPTIVG